MTPTALAALKALAEECSGMLPVYLSRERPLTVRDANGVAQADTLTTEPPATPFDLYLIAAMNAAPGLVAEVERLRRIEEAADSYVCATVGAESTYEREALRAALRGEP